MTQPPRGPVLIEVGDEVPDPAAAPAVDADESAPDGRAMHLAARLGGRRMSLAARAFLTAVTGFVALAVGLAAWDFAARLLENRPALGWLAAGLAGLAVVAFVVLAVREALALARLRSLGNLRRAADAALAAASPDAARAVSERLVRLCVARAGPVPDAARLAERQAELVDAPDILELAEAELLSPRDAEARREVEAAARQVATVTAFVPLALADVAVALLANLRMIRRIAEIYGGRSGIVGGWRLTRAVLTHLVATGAVSVGDDMIGSVAGGGLLSKLSRRFGEGVVNGALTARVGVAAIEVCRPLPFRRERAPKVSNLVRRALTGLFDRG